MAIILSQFLKNTLKNRLHEAYKNLLKILVGLIKVGKIVFGKIGAWEQFYETPFGPITF
jgi:hypothetical protein